MKKKKIWKSRKKNFRLAELSRKWRKIEGGKLRQLTIENWGQKKNHEKKPGKKKLSQMRS